MFDQRKSRSRGSDDRSPIDPLGVVVALLCVALGGVGRAQGVPVDAAHAWASAHPTSHNFGVVESLRPRGLYVSAELAIRGPVSLTSFPRNPAADGEVLGIGVAARFGGQVGRLGLGLRLDVARFNLPGAKEGGTVDGGLVTSGFLGELGVLLLDRRDFVLELEPAGGIALLIADVPLVPADGTSAAPPRTVGCASMGLALERSFFRLSLGVTLLGGTALGGGFALRAPVTTVDVRFGFRFRNAEVRP